MNNFKKTGAFIKKMREKAGLNKKEFAKYLNVTSSAVIDWEKGNGLKIENLYKIAAYFNVKVTDLLKGQNDNSIDFEIWKDNFRLEDYDFDAELNSTNLQDAQLFFRQCCLVKEMFFSMLEDWSFGRLNKNDELKFEFLYRYFSFDQYYAEDFLKIKNESVYSFDKGEIERTQKNNAKEAVRKIINKYTDIKEKEWEISKLFDINDTFKLFKKNEYPLLVFKEMFPLLNQVQKDYYLNVRLKKEVIDESKANLLTPKMKKIVNLSSDEIENDKIIAFLINNGSRCYFHEFYTSCFNLDLDEFEHLNGKKTELLQDFDEKYKEGWHVINDINSRNSYLIKNWKSLSFENYEYLISSRRTDVIKALVNYKDSDPLRYYEVLCGKDFN